MVIELPYPLAHPRRPMGTAEARLRRAGQRIMQRRLEALRRLRRASAAPRPIPLRRSA